ncbi:hypothetical protein DFQ26_002944, partial [Actinomortierella ambigua]
SKNVLTDDDAEREQQPAFSSVAQMMLNVVGKSAVAESAEAKTPAVLPLTSASQTSTTIRVDSTGSSPFSFAPVASKRTDSEEEEGEEERQEAVVEKSAPLSLDAIRKEAAASKANTTSSIFSVPAPGSLFATPAVTGESASTKDKKDASEVSKAPSLFSAPAAPQFGSASGG